MPNAHEDQSDEISERDVTGAAPVSPALVDSVLRALDLSSQIEALSDAELSERVLSEVWGMQRLGTVEESLLDEYIRRFESFAGIKRDEETGELLPPA